jgi:hypothetical protein
MKKFDRSLIPILFFIITAGVVLTSCKRDWPAHKHNFKASLKTWYRVSPTAPVSVVVNGTSYISVANLVVSGGGTATTIGNVESYANTLSYADAAEGAPVGGIGAPVTEIPGYPILGGPLPLLQAGDFADLPAVISALDIPTRSRGHIVDLVMFNKEGDAIFLSNIPGTGTSTPISSTVGGYTNKTLIVGGTGKFEHATGKLNNNGHFSFIAPYDGEDNYDGWISY